MRRHPRPDGNTNQSEKVSTCSWELGVGRDLLADVAVPIDLLASQPRICSWLTVMTETA